MALQLSHICALSLKWGTHQGRPALDLAAQRLDDSAGLLVKAPDEYGGTRAGDGCAQSAQLGRSPGQSVGTGEQVRAALLVQAVVQAARDQVPVAAGQTQ